MKAAVIWSHVCAVRLFRHAVFRYSVFKEPSERNPIIPPEESVFNRKNRKPENSFPGFLRFPFTLGLFIGFSSYIMGLWRVFQNEKNP